MMKYISVFLLFLTIAGCAQQNQQYLEYNGGKVYYDDSVTQQKAARLGDFLKKFDQFDGNYRKVYLSKKENRYIVRLVVKRSFAKDEATLKECGTFKKLIKPRVFPDDSFQFQLIDVHQQVLKTIE